MLKVTVSLIPGGVGPERKLGELHIINISGGSLSDYTCELHASDLTAPVRGISMEELDLLDAATKQAANDIAAMNEILDKGLARSERFFEEIAQLKGKL